MIEVTCDRCGVKMGRQKTHQIGEEQVDLCEKCERGLGSIEEMCEANRRLAFKRWLKEGNNGIVSR